MQKLSELQGKRIEVIAMPSFPDRLFVRRHDGSFLSIPVERFISFIVGGETK